MRTFILVLLTLISGAAFSGETELEPSKAFALSARLKNPNTLEVRYRIAPGYYLYRDKISFDSSETTVTVEKPNLPLGEQKNDPLFGKVQTYRDEVVIAIKLSHPGPISGFELKAKSQGCADVGICYPPQEQLVPIRFSETNRDFFPLLRKVDMFTASNGNGDFFSAPSPNETSVITGAPQADENRLARLLTQGGFWVAVASFFGFGLILAFTPCVYPMIPILSGIVLGQGKKLSKLNGLLLSSAYVLGMAITYALVGIAAGLTGSLFTSALQNTWVLGGFAIVMVLLALAMFDVYELQLPSVVQSKFSNVSNRFKGGHLISIFVMGVLSALIIGPCVAPPLAAALLVISQTRDIMLGGSALFAMALGMGVPLLVLGVSAGALFPKSGPWMQAVKRFFGVTLLGVAIWLVSPVIPILLTMMLWAALLIVTAIYLHALDPLPHGASGLKKLWKGIGVILVLFGAAVLIGALSGSRDILQPLGGLRVASDNRTRTQIEFEPIASLGELKQRIKTAQGSSVMVDFYADWCVSCQEMERFTFSDARVVSRTRDIVKLRVDVTKNTAADKELLKHFSVFGPPAIVFVDRNGVELPQFRVIGFKSAQDFLASINALTK